MLLKFKIQPLTALSPKMIGLKTSLPNSRETQWDLQDLNSWRTLQAQSTTTSQLTLTEATTSLKASTNSITSNRIPWSSFNESQLDRIHRTLHMRVKQCLPISTSTYQARQIVVLPNQIRRREHKTSLCAWQRKKSKSVSHRLCNHLAWTQMKCIQPDEKTYWIILTQSSSQNSSWKTSLWSL